MSPQVLTAATSPTVTFDKYSLLVDGHRLVLWSGEFHPFRLPSPLLWTDMNGDGNLVLNCDSHDNYDPYSSDGAG